VNVILWCWLKRLYPTTDANFNVGSVTSSAGVVLERYAYDPFGAVTYLNASGTVIAATTIGWQYLHQGGRQESASGLINFRNRDYSPTLGRWVTMDPMGY
jgi:RHS repeat-associated protein